MHKLNYNFALKKESARNGRPFREHKKWHFICWINAYAIAYHHRHYWLQNVRREIKTTVRNNKKTTHHFKIWTFSKYFHLHCRQKKPTKQMVGNIFLNYLMHRIVCVFLWLYRAGSSFRVTEQMYIYLLHLSTECALRWMRPCTANLDDVQFGFCNKRYTYQMCIGWLPLLAWLHATMNSILW